MATLILNMDMEECCPNGSVQWVQEEEKSAHCREHCLGRQWEPLAFRHPLRCTVKQVAEESETVREREYINSD